MPAIRIFTDPDCDTNEFCEFEGEIDRLTDAMVESDSRGERNVLRRELMQLLHAALSEFDEASRYLVSAAEILCQFDTEHVKNMVEMAARAEERRRAREPSANLPKVDRFAT